LDYKNVKTIQKPEGFDEDAAPGGEDGDASANVPSITYLAGRIFLDTNGRWVYEAFHHCFTSDKYPNLVENLAEIYRTGDEELHY
jgi:hypothetical protein